MLLIDKLRRSEIQHSIRSRRWPLSRGLNILAVSVVVSGLAGPTQRAIAQLPPVVTDAARASVLTVYPGEFVYNAWGHSAIRIRDPRIGLDASFNYGTFEFDPLFVPKFIRGKLDYSLSVSGTERSIQFYIQEQRTIVEQHLDLSPNQVQLLYNFLLTNYRPENRYYRYDFFFDNCSTRIADALQAVLSDSLSTNSIETSDTFRDLLHPYLAKRPFLSAGIDLVIGMDADEVATYSERTFLPVELEQQLARAQLGHRALVSQTDTLYVPRAGRDGSMLSWSWLLWLFVPIVLILSRFGSDATLRRFDAGLFLVTGAAGVIILFLWFATDHVVTDRNLNLAWTWPTNLVLGWRVLQGRKPAWLQYNLTLYGLSVAILIAGWAFWMQDLPDLLLPVVVVVLLRTLLRLRSGKAKPESVEA